jgi:hypothetical protein
MCVTFYPRVSLLDADADSQMVFLIDLPRKAEGSANEPENMFLQELKHFMLASGFHANIISKLDEWDFSQTSDMAFVHTM